MVAARLTFKRKANGKCHQRVLREYYDESPPGDVDLSVSNARVRPVSMEIAKRVILKYEWLGTMGQVTQRAYGIFFGMYCGGVTCISASYAITSTCKRVGVLPTEASYLSRGACVSWASPNTNSKLLSWACKYERKRGRKVVVAMSDTDAGEVGTVYQASGWLCLGRGSKWPQWVSPKGKIWSFQAFTTLAKNQGVSTTKLRSSLLSAGWYEQKTNPKFTYVAQLDRDPLLRARLLKLAVAYPKRAGSDPATRQQSHAGKGGAAPTPALMLECGDD